MVLTILFSLMAGVATGGLVYLAQTVVRSIFNPLPEARLESKGLDAMAAFIKFSPFRPPIKRCGDYLASISWLENHFRKLLEDARWPFALEVPDWLGFSTVLGIALSPFAILMHLANGPVAGVIAFVTCVVIGFLAIHMYLASYAKQRKERIRFDFPYAVDLMILGIGGGAGLLQALELLVGAHHDHPIRDEFGQVLGEIRMGRTHAAALEAMTNRVPLFELRQFSLEVTQSEDLGTPLSENLRRLASDLRSRRIQDAQSKAGTAAVKMHFPIFLLFITCVIITFSTYILSAWTGKIKLLD